MVSSSQFLNGLHPRSSEISDEEWLRTLSFRDGRSSPLAEAAQEGKLKAFSRALIAAYDEECPLGKGERGRVLKSIRILATMGRSPLDTAVREGSLLHCLLDPELSRDELSGRVEAIIASTVEGRADLSTLTAACWLLRLRGDRLEPQTFLTLLRWVCDTVEEEPNPEEGCAVWDTLELQTCRALCLPGRKGARKQLRRLAKSWRESLEAMTDTDGTPHAKWLSGFLFRFAQLAMVSLFAELMNVTLWDGKSQKRLENLFARTSLLITAKHVAFHDCSASEAATLLLTIADVLRLELSPGLREQLDDWHREGKRRRSPAVKSRPRFPASSVQSDWAEWAHLRSGWQGEADAVTVHHVDLFPEIDVVVKDLPLFVGEWSHALTVGGKSVPNAGEWTCCCWSLDKDAAFLELQMGGEGPVDVYRQVVLLRKENVLLLADSIRSKEVEGIDYQRTIPVVSGWDVEEDTLSREFQLVRGENRVRVFPWTGPQMRLHRSDEVLSFRPGEMHLQSRTDGRSLYAATLFDWSEKRRDEVIDWQRVTVVENGEYISPDVAVAHRLRLGKKQWIIYHSHQKPAFPRSAMGIHTLSETVFASLSSSGEVTTLVEVEL